MSFVTRQRERALAPRARHVLDHVGRAARLREREHGRAAASRCACRSGRSARSSRAATSSVAAGRRRRRRTRRRCRTSRGRPSGSWSRAARAPARPPRRRPARARAARAAPAAASGSPRGSRRRAARATRRPQATTRASPPTQTRSISRLSSSTTRSAGNPTSRRPTVGRPRTRAGTEVAASSASGSGDAERVEVPHRLDHRQRAAGQHVVEPAHDAVADLDLGAGEQVGAVAHARAGDGVGHERDAAGGRAPDEPRRLLGAGARRRG